MGDVTRLMYGAKQVSVVGVTERTCTRRRHPQDPIKGLITVTARIEKCVSWCPCGWHSRVVESKTRAIRELVRHEVDCPDLT